MPDLDEVVMATCMTNIMWQRKVRSSTGSGFYVVRFERVPLTRGGVQYDYTCTCSDYLMRRANFPGAYCKHILQVQNERCGWDQLADGGTPVRESGSTLLCCPRCKGFIDFYKTGV